MKEGVDVEVAEGDLGSGGGIVDGWVGIGKDSVGVSKEAGEEVVLEVCTREGLAVLMLDGERLPVRGLEACGRHRTAGGGREWRDDERRDRDSSGLLVRGTSRIWACKVPDRIS